ncbi:MAG: CBS domain-containing protein, partial [Calditrichia bacterium]|nr:CBS domain-containing protein [Calditrichia bacterium]
GEKIGVVNYKVLMKEAVVEMANKRGICVITDNDGKLTGVVTTGDLNRLVKTTEHFFDIPVIDIMNENPKTILTGTLAYTAYKKMEKFSIIALPVVDGERNIEGIIHLHDIMKAGII